MEKDFSPFNIKSHKVYSAMRKQESNDSES